MLKPSLRVSQHETASPQPLAEPRTIDKREVDVLNVLCLDLKALKTGIYLVWHFVCFIVFSKTRSLKLFFNTLKTFAKVVLLNPAAMHPLGRLPFSQLQHSKSSLVRLSIENVCET